MLETHSEPFWSLLSSILGCLMLPLMIVAILSSIMGGAGNFVGTVLAEGIQTLTAFAFEVLFRLFRLALAFGEFFLRLMVRIIILLYSHFTNKS